MKSKDEKILISPAVWYFSVMVITLAVGIAVGVHMWNNNHSKVKTDQEIYDTMTVKEENVTLPLAGKKEINTEKEHRYIFYAGTEDFVEIDVSESTYKSFDIGDNFTYNLVTLNETAVIARTTQSDHLIDYEQQYRYELGVSYESGIASFKKYISEQQEEYLTEMDNDLTARTVGAFVVYIIGCAVLLQHITVNGEWFIFKKMDMTCHGGTN